MFSRFTQLCHASRLWPVGVRTCALGLAVMLAALGPARAARLNGTEIMAESQRRHQQFPYVYEEQSMILIDSRGHREVRRSRLYTRRETDGSVKFLLIFDHPEAIRGVALIASRNSDGQIQPGVYLPAFGQEIKQPRGSGLDGRFLGTDFTIADLTPEPAEEFRYVRLPDRFIEGQAYFVIDAYPREIPNRAARDFSLRRHLLRQDNFMVVQTDIYDPNLRFYKRISYHDLKRVDGDSWRANIVIAYDHREEHRTVLKINRRVYSQDYVPASLFEESFLLENRHVSNPATGVRKAIASTAEQQLLERAND